MKPELINILFSFTFFSIFGWLLEVVYRSFCAKHFINPGLLKGPYLSLYGAGALLLIAVVPILRDFNLAIKIFSYFIITTGLELTAGFIAEYLFHKRLWDYSDERFNYKGHVCLKFSVYWILLAFLFERLIFIPYHTLIFIIPQYVKIIFSAAISMVMIIDFLIVSIKTFLKIGDPEEKIAADKEFTTLAEPLIKHPAIIKLSNYNHHNGKTRLEHSKEVAYYSFLWGKKLSLDCHAIVKGALMHDLFYYDWLREGPRLHGFRHPAIALNNARKIMRLSAKEEDIIKKHMWPLTLVPPRYIESFVVSFVDTYFSTKDYLFPRKTISGSVRDKLK